jgi:hypothetical protein
MLIGLGVCQSRQQPHIKFFPNAINRSLRHFLRYQQVSVEREVRPMLLYGSKRLHDDAVRSDALGDVRAA